TTTNIVTTPLNAQCTVPWNGPNYNPKCCTSDLTLAQFKTLQGKMDASTPAAITPQGFLAGTADWRTNLYTGRGPGNLVTLRESIQINESNGVQHTPELKAGNPDRINATFGSQAKYAQKMIDEFKAAGISPSRVWPQSFNKDD